MQPQFRIIADGNDITTLINDRLLSLRTTDKPSMESDEFELRIDARDGAVALPARGALLEVHLGYAGRPLSRLGRYTVDEVELSGPPDTLVIRGKASDLRGTGKTIRSGSWENVTLQRIVAEIAARNGWQAVCPVAALVPRVDQYSESDFNFITRLARLHDCTAKLANGQLLVMPRQGGQSASGKPLGVVTIARADVSQWQFRLADKNTHKAVRARHPDSASGRLQAVELVNGDAPQGVQPVYTDRHLYPNRAAAEQAVRARLASFNRDSASVRLDMPGRTDLFAERSIETSGFLAGLDGVYLIESVEQMFTGTGWRTTVQCNGGRQGKARAKGAAPYRSGALKA
ncbi:MULTISPECIES: contractile injection system protein, VgrG/Pvc8 family [unclassified Pseudomonas]|uniref:phage late control D family protein n=1 Tax=unclassified Pseudomonas TaxID=196821 RepID=UPI0024499DA6|nr:MULTISPECIES: contractile injection system protein, VgrG/Pvc8 family [unclassified Pseudomonas]MDH0300573.1 contractile injection system protein, VgrG/Pvc8 family [Pseudomonas sp. GD04091]MDH1984276.1 contractile injection system protein, VgrG/Pvc8 family [Pseudomonas sp. GD03689]